MKILVLVLILALVLIEVQGTFEAFKKKHTHNEAQGQLKCTNHMKNVNNRVPCRPFNSVIIIPKNTNVLDKVKKVCRGEGTNINLPNEDNIYRGNYYRSNNGFKIVDCTLTPGVYARPVDCQYTNGEQQENRIITVVCEAAAPNNEAQGELRKPVHFEKHEAGKQ